MEERRLIDVTIMTVDKEYAGYICPDDISVMIRMTNKSTYVELQNGSKYRLKESPKEITEKSRKSRQNGSTEPEKASKRKKTTI